MKNLLASGVAALSLLAFSIGTIHADDMPGKGKSVVAIKAPGPNTQFQALVVEAGLKKLGYEIKETREAQFPILHLSLATGDADYTTGNWKPLHNAFFEKAGGDEKITHVGALIKGAGQGYFIDKKTADAHNISNIGQLTDPKFAALFDHDNNGRANLAGCVPGWGCERVIEHQLDAFELRDAVDHDQGEYFALIADVISRYKSDKSIFFYTWTPNWVAGVLEPGKDVVQLDVPFSSLPDNRDADTAQANGSNPGFEVNDVFIVANNEFLADNPAAKKFFELVDIPINAINAQNLKMRDGEDTMEDFQRHTADWIAANQDQFDGWIKQAAAAVN